MKQIQPDLWESNIERPAPGLTTHAYLLTRHNGNILFYNTSIRRDIEQMASIGGVAFQYLSHQDEVGKSLLIFKEKFNAKLGGHSAEYKEFSEVRPPDIVFQRRETHLGNVEVIPTPGHTPGSTCFLVHSPTGKRYLFTGDTLYLAGGDTWRAGYINGISDREALVESLLLLRGIEPDVVISSAFSGPAGFQEMTSPSEWPRQVDEAVGRLL